jgi:tRNA A-37 threonylcarbamoyl transferase component Bud32
MKEIISKKTFRYLTFCRQDRYTPEMKSFLEDPEIAFTGLDDSSNNLLLKKGNSATIVRYKLDGHDLVIKRYNMKTRVHALRRAFKCTRANHSWHYAHIIKDIGIDTPLPIAIKEKRWGPFRNKAFFICEYVKGPTVLDYFQDPQFTDNDKSMIAKQITEMLGILKSSMISHGDMKATNIIIHKDKPFLLDLDSMVARRSKRRFIRAWKKDIKRFMKNWKDLPEISQLFNQLTN